MYLLNYFLVKYTFWEQVEREFQEIIDMFKDFFYMIKGITYDKIAELIGPDIALMVTIAIGAIFIMIVCLKIINR